MQIEHIRPVRPVKKRQTPDEDPHIDKTEEISATQATEDVVQEFFSLLFSSNNTLNIAGLNLNFLKNRNYTPSSLTSQAMNVRLVRLQEYMDFIKDPDSQDEYRHGIASYNK